MLAQKPRNRSSDAWFTTVFQGACRSCLPTFGHGKDAARLNATVLPPRPDYIGDSRRPQSDHRSPITSQSNGTSVSGCPHHGTHQTMSYNIGQRCPVPGGAMVAIVVSTDSWWLDQRVSTASVKPADQRRRPNSGTPQGHGSINAPCQTTGSVASDSETRSRYPR